MNRLRVAIVADYLEEGWPSMDLVAAMLLDHLEQGHADEIEAVRVCPPFKHRLGRLPLRRAAAIRNGDRLLNRAHDYPRFLRRLSSRAPFDVYHVVDHSYAQLVHALPPGRSVVTCHDLDTFRCLLRPDLEPRPFWFRAMTRRTLDGLRRAAVITCPSEATGAALHAGGLAIEGRVHVIPYGTHPAFLAPTSAAGEAEAARLVGPRDPDGPPDLLHVGSNIARKRIDVLLATFAGVRRAIPGARLIKVGGELTAPQHARACELGVSDAIRVIPSVTDRTVLAALYRRAALVLQPSEAEGFGLPLAEALTCGAPVLASDLPVLHEVAGAAAVYRPVGDVDAWIAAALALLDEPPDARRARRDLGEAHAARYRWDAHVARLLPLYRAVAAQTPR